MKLRWLSFLALGFSVSLAAAPEPSALDQRSDKPASLVIVGSDLVLNGDRLVIKVVAYNKGTAPAALGPEQVRISMANGDPVPLMPLADLENDLWVAHGLKPPSRSGDWSTT